MKRWLRRIRGALLMGLTWAVLWAPVGLLIGMIVDPTGAMDEPWIAVGTFPGFPGGVLFSTVSMAPDDARSNHRMLTL